MEAEVAQHYRGKCVHPECLTMVDGMVLSCEKHKGYAAEEIAAWDGVLYHEPDTASSDILSESNWNGA